MAKKVVKKAATKKAVKKTPAKKVLHKTQPAVEIQKVEDRQIIYPTPNVVLHIGEKAITVEKAKKLLGWMEEGDKKFAGDFEHSIRALFGKKKIRLYNNSRNRPIQPQSIMTLAQEVLRKNWHLNFETIIVGKTGLLLNGQHSLLALIYAAMLWEKDKEKYEGWKTEPTMEKLVGYGCSEDLNVIKTMDTCKPSSLSDVIYRCDYFKGHSPKACKILCKMAEFAVRQVWSRTGVGHAFSPGLRGTHAEFLNFIDRHPKLLDCVKHIYEEEDVDGGEDKRKISKVISCGYAAGLLYLMGCSQSDPKSYHEADPSNENMLNWDQWDKACDFWVGIAGKEKKFLAIRQALGKTIEDDDSSVVAKVCIVIKAWNLHAANKSITVDDLLLKYDTDEDGERTLAEHPTLGGIDLGNPKDQPDLEVTEPEVQERKAKVDKEKTASNGQPNGLATKLTMKKSTKKATKKVSGGPKVGDVVWVIDDNGGHWSGELIEIYSTVEGPVGRIIVAKGFGTAGKTFESPMSKVQLTKPEER